MTVKDKVFKALREKPLQKLEKIDFTNALEGWASPIEFVYQNAQKTYLEQIEGHIMARCEEVLGVKVDRDELIKAMNYDREQYKKGFENGYKQRDKEIVRCKDCKYSESVSKWKDFEHGCMLHREYIKETDFCSQAERKEEE